ncbi:MAG: cation diffusion facilitator family transporter [Phascolarctobacterium sp.]|nr:cation diffusion facilitator family transporter [Phascolarctobacterium sp.]
MHILYKLLKQEANSREGVIVVVAALGIIVNLTMAIIKIAIGMTTSSIAIMSEGVNHATDCATSLLTIIGTKLAGQHPTKEHPFGFGRIEYLTSLVIAILIIITGIELLKSSVELIFNPEPIDITYATIGLIAVSAIIKILLGQYVIKEGKRVGSGSLVAVGLEDRADSIVSVVTIISSLIFLTLDVNLDAYAGVFTSLFILKAGGEVIYETITDLLGRSGDKELAAKLYKIIRQEPIVINAADMMLHNYGPDAYSGSVNIEVDHKHSLNEIYTAIHKLQLKIMHEMNITMVFGIYAVDQDHELLKEMRKYIVDFVRKHDHVTSFHALYIDPDNEDIYCDIVVDYDLKDWEALREEFTAYMQDKYPGRNLHLVIETEYV